MTDSSTSAAPPPAAGAPGSGGRTFAVWIMAVPLMAMGLVGVILPPALSYSLVTRGIDEGHTSWLVFGALTGAAWLAGSCFMVRRALRLRAVKTPA